MDISIVDHELPDETHNFYDVYFYTDRINTLVTHDPGMVATWLAHTQRIHRRRLRNLVVGLDVEWRPNFNKHVQNPVATLQFCVGRRCLVFQILHCSRESPSADGGFPAALLDFLGDGDYTFVGVGIEGDLERLLEDYGLSVGGRVVDLRDLAADGYDDRRLKRAGLRELAGLVLERDVEKPRRVTMGRWDNRWLTPEQVQYACVDAFVSFEIGVRLNASQYY